jgi:carbonic anhydrase/acetyltransferase-like protein (isoleucine patch superfamily)
MTIRTFDGITPLIESTAYIDDAALVIGDVEIGADSSVWPMTVVRGDVNSIRIGERTNIQDGSVLHVSHKGPFGEGSALVIGNDVTVGHKAVLHACTVKDCSLIGMSATVLDGAIINEYVMVGAGSLVPPKKELESGYLYLGNPVRQVRALTEKEKEFLHYSAAHYVRLQRKYAVPSTN